MQLNNCRGALAKWTTIVYPVV